jgi:hypothetical protein
LEARRWAEAQPAVARHPGALADAPRRGAKSPSRLEPAHMTARFASFREFYPFYLSEHADRTCRRLHFAGSTLVLVVLVAAIATQRWMLLWLVPVIGYGFAWIGHFFFEHNRPATFKNPFYSLAGDWVMYWQILTRRLPL